MQRAWHTRRWPLNECLTFSRLALGSLYLWGARHRSIETIHTTTYVPEWCWWSQGVRHIFTNEEQRSRTIGWYIRSRPRVQQHWPAVTEGEERGPGNRTSLHCSLSFFLHFHHNNRSLRFIFFFSFSRERKFVIWLPGRRKSNERLKANRYFRY